MLTIANIDIKTLYNRFAMLSHESKIDIIADIIYEHLKGKHKEKLSKELAEEILKELDSYE